MNKQTGDVLLEAIIGVLITAWLGAGMAYISTQLLQQKTDTKIISATISEMKNVLERDGDKLCGQSPSISVFNKQASIEVSCVDQPAQTVTSAAGSISVESPKKVTLRVSPIDIGLSGDVPITVVMGL